MNVIGFEIRDGHDMSRSVCHISAYFRVYTPKEPSAKCTGISVDVIVQCRRNASVNSLKRKKDLRSGPVMTVKMDDLRIKLTKMLPQIKKIASG